MKPVIKWTLWQRRLSTIWWSVGAFALLFINMIFYPSFKNDADELQKSFENLPDAALQLLGGSTDFFSPVGYINSQIFFFMLPLFLGILAIALGSGLVRKEEQEKTLETLLARPISRTALITSKGIAGTTVLLIVTTVSLLTTLVSARAVELEVASSRIIAATAVCFLLVLSFGAIAFALSATGRAKSASLGIATVIALGGYLVSSLAGTVSWLATPAKLFPFHYYQSEDILSGTYNTNNLLYFAVLLILCAVVSWISFRRRDLA